ncbi:MAG TPA: S53 family peptidase [Streptosporangiaceae bacterium]
MRQFRKPAVAVAIPLLVACLPAGGGALAGGGSLAVAGPLASGTGAALPASRGVGSADAPAVLISPDWRHVTGAHDSPPTTAFCEKHYQIACYLPRQIERAYRLPLLYRAGITGKGQTIVIVDSFGSPTIRHDLAVFDKAAGLPAPPSLRIIQPAGKVPPYQASSTREGWAGETSLDVEYAHAIAPGAGLLLVETPTAENEGTTGFPQIVRAEKYVIDHHLGGVISQSFSATEQTFATPERLLTLRGAYVDAARNAVTVLAASGDSGAGDVRYNGATYYLRPATSWPDSDPLVTGVGGTALHLDSRGRQVTPATAWNDTYDVATNRFIFGTPGPNPLASGGGKSVIFGRPSYQDHVRGVVGTSRGVPDISMSGACDGAVDVYQSFPGQPAGWYPTCGTSESTPEFAGIVALAEQVAGHGLGLINSDLYRLSSIGARGIADVVGGSNTVSFRQGSGHRLVTISGYRALPGYDLVTGVGTVNGPAFVRELAWLARHPQTTTSQRGIALARGF